ncbi:MAG: hypothetical protein J5379_02755 [Clostridiales bacterium]|nr:hypothetical protein [Clostridiales bacterium]
MKKIITITAKTNIIDVAAMSGYSVHDAKRITILKKGRALVKHEKI